MTLDTVFDLASLTKVDRDDDSGDAAVEQGSVRMNDPVAKYLRSSRRTEKKTLRCGS